MGWIVRRIRWAGAVLPLALALSACERPATVCGSDCETGPAQQCLCASHTTCRPGLSWEGFGDPFIRTYCLACHSVQSTGEWRLGAPAGTDYDTLDDVRRQAIQIDRWTVGSIEMPPANYRSQPTDAERRELGAWLACGVPASGSDGGPGPDGG